MPWERPKEIEKDKKKKITCVKYDAVTLNKTYKVKDTIIKLALPQKICS